MDASYPVRPAVSFRASEGTLPPSEDSTVTTPSRPLRHDPIAPLLASGKRVVPSPAHHYPLLETWKQFRFLVAQYGVLDEVPAPLLVEPSGRRSRFHLPDPPLSLVPHPPGRSGLVHQPSGAERPVAPGGTRSSGDSIRHAGQGAGDAALGHAGDLPDPDQIRLPVSRPLISVPVDRLPAVAADAALRNRGHLESPDRPFFRRWRLQGARKGG